MIPNEHSTFTAITVRARHSERGAKAWWPLIFRICCNFSYLLESLFPVAVDNKSVEFAVNNPETSQRTRHLDTRYFKVRDYIRDLSIRVRHIGTKFNPADFFTKALARSDFERYRNYLGMEDHTPPT